MTLNIRNHVVFAPAVAGLFFPLAGELKRPPRENVTPVLLQKIVWTGANLGSYQQASAALNELLGVTLAIKQVQRITSQIGADTVEKREQSVAEHQARPLMEKVSAPPDVTPPDLGVVMMDGGRFQRRDNFLPRHDAAATETTPQTDSNPISSEESSKTHWREDKVGIVLSMTSKVHEQDPTPEFPDWLAHSSAVAELAHLTARDEQAEDTASPSDLTSITANVASQNGPCANWQDLAPELVSREVVASSANAQKFGCHLEWKAWTLGIPGAARQAFVADGGSMNWTIHSTHFSQMTGVLDLMHALSYAWRVAETLDDPQSYRRYATWIWQGRVEDVIRELHEHKLRLPPREAGSTVSSREDRINRALTYYENHQHLMDYPAYRQQGLPLTSSHIESTVKLINIRMKGTEKFWRQDNGESLLQLRADTLSHSGPLNDFWTQWRANQTGANHYRKSAV